MCQAFHNYLSSNWKDKCGNLKIEWLVKGQSLERIFKLKVVHLHGGDETAIFVKQNMFLNFQELHELFANNMIYKFSIKH